jgi:hypothetical protein
MMMFFLSGWSAGGSACGRDWVGVFYCFNISKKRGVL